MKVRPERYQSVEVRNGRLFFGGADTVALAQKFGTPLYVIDDNALRAACRAFRAAFEKRYENVTVLFAVKANAALAVMRTVVEEGLGLDVASLGELEGASRAGADMENVFFHGNYKKADEIETALRAGIGRIVLDSELEADAADAAARKLGTKARVLLRVTPGIEAHVHEMVQVGRLDTKFGVPLEGGAAAALAGKILRKRNLVFYGVHFHIGSQILESEPFKLAVMKGVGLVAELRERYGAPVREFDIGGGYPVRYDSKQSLPTPDEFAAAVCGTLKRELDRHGLPAPRLLLEPGRSIAGPAGMTLYTIGPVKNIPGVRNYIAVDGGLSDNPRPALYGSLYEAVVANRPLDSKGLKKYRVCGRHCETDTLVPELELPDPRPGEVLSVFTTGAYNYSMSGNYNKFPRPATVMLRNGRPELAIRRETVDDLFDCDISPARKTVAKKKRK
jgi:diaminopimelate decarboxylase